MAERRCPTCNQVTTLSVGLHGDNFKKLFRRPSLQEWIILFMLVMVLFLAYAYKSETQICRDTIKDLNERGLLNDQPYMFGGAGEINMDEFNSSLAELNLSSNNDQTKASNREVPKV